MRRLVAGLVVAVLVIAACGQPPSNEAGGEGPQALEILAFGRWDGWNWQLSASREQEKYCTSIHPNGARGSICSDDTGELDAIRTRFIKPSRNGKREFYVGQVHRDARILFARLSLGRRVDIPILPASEENATQNFFLVTLPYRVKGEFVARSSRGEIGRAKIERPPAS